MTTAARPPRYCLHGQPRRGVRGWQPWLQHCPPTLVPRPGRTKQGAARHAQVLRCPHREARSVAAARMNWRAPRTAGFALGQDRGPLHSMHACVSPSFLPAALLGRPNHFRSTSPHSSGSHDPEFLLRQGRAGPSAASVGRRRASGHMQAAVFLLDSDVRPQQQQQRSSRRRLTWHLRLRWSAACCRPGCLIGCHCLLPHPQTPAPIVPAHAAVRVFGGARCMQT